MLRNSERAVRLTGKDKIMPTSKSGTLRSEVIEKLKSVFTQIHLVDKVDKDKRPPLIYRINKSKVHIRVSCIDQDRRFWFDIMTSVYELRMADFLLFACESVKDIYIFPAKDFAELIKGAGVSTDTGRPNFYLHLGVHKFEPAGGLRKDVQQYYNNFKLIK